MALECPECGVVLYDDILAEGICPNCGHEFEPMRTKEKEPEEEPEEERNEEELEEGSF